MAPIKGSDSVLIQSNIRFKHRQLVPYPLKTRRKPIVSNKRPVNLDIGTIKTPNNLIRFDTSSYIRCRIILCCSPIALCF